MPSPRFRSKTLAKAVKKCTKVDIKHFLSCPVLLDFPFLLFQIFCPGLSEQSFGLLSPVSFKLCFLEILHIIKAFLQPLPQVKQNVIFSITNLVYDLPHELVNYLRLRILGNKEILRKSQIWMVTFLGNKITDAVTKSNDDKIVNVMKIQEMFKK